jgi:aldose sugar dehydrogenase
MERGSRAAYAIVLLLILGGMSSGAAQGPLLPAPGEPLVLQTNTGRVRVVLVAEGLVHPWSIAFLPGENTMFVTERTGRLRIIRNGVLDPDPIWEVPADLRTTDRLRTVVIHPRFAENRFVYLSYAKWAEDGRNTLAVARGRFDGTQLTGVRDVFVADAWETSGNLAGRMLFGLDGTLYVTVGDRDRLCCVGYEDNSLRMKAQDLGNHVGKTLRIRDDGGVPADNPFVGRADAKPEIFTYGHRNGYGLAFHPDTGELWQAEIGPLAGDEVNILLPGRNYGWPLVSTGRNYTGTLVSEQPWWRPGMEMPRLFWVPAISPSSIAFYTGDQFPEWKGNLFVTALNGQQLQRIAFEQPVQAERREPLLRQLGVRFRDVQQGPDGYLYVTTEMRQRGDSPDGTVLRIEPAEPVELSTD